MGAFNAAFTDLLAVIINGNLATLGQAAAIVGKLHSHLVLTGWNCLASLRGESLETEEVIGELAVTEFDLEHAFEPIFVAPLILAGRVVARKGVYAFLRAFCRFHARRKQ